MNEIVSVAKAELETLSSAQRGKHISTSDIRKLSAKLFHTVKDKSKDNVFAICCNFLEHHNWAMGVIAYDFAYRMKKHYDGSTFSLFESWLEKYVRGWGDCDDFCTHAFGELIIQNTALVESVIPWTKRKEFWMRRAAAVVLIPSIRHDKYKETNPLQISDILLTDKHDLVRKGYGWMLKILSLKEPETIRDYLVKNKEVMPRVAFRYAIQKMDIETKRELMKL